MSDYLGMEDQMAADYANQKKDSAATPSREEWVSHWLDHWREVREDAHRVAESGFLRIRDRGDLEMALMVADKLAALLAEEVERDA